MSTLVYPDVITANTTADATQVESNFLAISTVINGSLEMGTNVAAAAPIAQTSASLQAGASTSGARSDHAHVIRCTEQLTADPSSSNFVGRRYFNTSTLKERLCIATAASGTWVTMGNYSAADLPTHASAHGATGADQIDFAGCQLTKAGTVGITTATLTALNFGTGAGTENYDNDTMHDMTTQPTRITFTHGGLYAVTANLAWAPDATGNRWATIQLNGAGTTLAGSVVPGASTESPIHSLAVDYKATAGDYIQLFVYQNSGGTLNVIGTGTSLVLGTRTAPMTFGARWVGTGV